MTSIRIAAAQSISKPADLAANVLVHTQFIAAAQRTAVDLLVFPELSLSGYELPRLQECLVHPGDRSLAPIRDLVGETGMTVVVGAPIAADGSDKPSIGAITFFPDGRTSVYCKQHLHPSEEHYVAAGGAGSRRDELLGQSFALAICADTSHAQHAAGAAASGASLYLAGVLVSEAGYAADSAALQTYAAKFGFGVLMANHGGPSGGYVSAGRSAFWAPGGRQVVAAPGAGNLLLVAANGAGEWRGELHAVVT